MIKGGGKAKGAQFERLLCGRLSLWASGGLKEDLYWRSAMSGGRATVAKERGTDLAAQAGDISCVHPLGHQFITTFYVELKFYKDLQFYGLLINKGNLANFWTVAKKESARYSKLPLLIAKQNQQPIIACTSRTGLDVLNLKLKCSLTAPRLNFYAVLLEDFLKYAKVP